MISESVIALVWAAAGVAFYGSTQLLNEALKAGASNVVYEISSGVLGSFGAVLAVAGVIVCPITSGDTAFRSARLILAETFRLDQKKMRNRLLVTVPLLVLGGILTWYATSDDKGFQTVWRYFSWSNQTLAMIALWVATAYLLRSGKRRFASLLTALPAAFMSAVSLTYILMAKEGFGLSAGIAYPAGAAFAAVLFAVYMAAALKKKGQHEI
jgi:carbon starvation protein CstA